MADMLETTPKNIERWLKQLKKSGLIAFIGATKTGIYHAICKIASPVEMDN